MKILKNRKIAILITAAVAVLATLIGVNRSLNRLAQDIERMFYDGVYRAPDGYTEPSIYIHLDNSADAALGLATLLQNYTGLGEKAEDLLSARRELLSAESISAKSIQDSHMIQAFVELIQAAKETDLPDRDIEAVSRYLQTFSGAHISIANSLYHEKVLQYTSDISPLAEFISMLTPGRLPESFNPNPVPAIAFP